MRNGCSMPGHATLLMKMSITQFGRCNEHIFGCSACFTMDCVFYGCPYYNTTLNQHVYGDAIMHVGMNIINSIPNVSTGNIDMRCQKMLDCQCGRFVGHHKPYPTGSFIVTQNEMVDLQETVTICYVNVGLDVFQDKVPHDFQHLQLFSSSLQTSRWTLDRTFTGTCNWYAPVATANVASDVGPNTV